MRSDPRMSGSLGEEVFSETTPASAAGQGAWSLASPRPRPVAAETGGPQSHVLHGRRCSSDASELVRLIRNVGIERVMFGSDCRT